MQSDGKDTHIVCGCGIFNELDIAQVTHNSFHAQLFELRNSPTSTKKGGEIIFLRFDQFDPAERLNDDCANVPV